MRLCPDNIGRGQRHGSSGRSVFRFFVANGFVLCRWDVRVGREPLCDFRVVERRAVCSGDRVWPRGVVAIELEECDSSTATEFIFRCVDRERHVFAGGGRSGAS